MVPWCGTWVSKGLSSNSRLSGLASGEANAKCLWQAQKCWMCMVCPELSTSTSHRGPNVSITIPICDHCQHWAYRLPYMKQIWKHQCCAYGKSRGPCFLFSRFSQFEVDPSVASKTPSLEIDILLETATWMRSFPNKSQSLEATGSFGTDRKEVCLECDSNRWPFTVCAVWPLWFGIVVCRGLESLGSSPTGCPQKIFLYCHP